MKIPQMFRPEKISDEKIKSLESVKEKELGIGSLTDLILNEGPYAKYAFSSEIHKLTYERLYSSISKTDLIDNIGINYSSSENNFTPHVDIFKFQDTQTMIKNISNMIECARKTNDNVQKINSNLEVYIIVKDLYACFVYVSDYSQKEEIVDTYKNKFGFKEVKK